MPTAGDYEIEFSINGSRQPDKEHQESIWYEAGLVCRVRLDDMEVHIYRDGADALWDENAQEFYRDASELPSDIRTDSALLEAIDDYRLKQENNSWFDIYNDEGEHLDLVTHTFDDAFETACEYLIDHFVNMCQIENNQIPQVEGRRVVVLDLEE